MSKYIKPETNVVIVDGIVSIMSGSKEPEVTGNIGAKENAMFECEDELFVDLWDDKSDDEEE
jgi:hypothetical protein